MNNKRKMKKKKKEMQSIRLNLFKITVLHGPPTLIYNALF
jgi:hypothetical protein